MELIRRAEYKIYNKSKNIFSKISSFLSKHPRDSQIDTNGAVIMSFFSLCPTTRPPFISSPVRKQSSHFVSYQI